MSSTESPYRIVFLYTELAGYIRVCMDQLQRSGAEVHVISWPVNPDAPFQFDNNSGGARYYQRNIYTHASLCEAVKNIDPHMVVCSGWMDKGYLKVCRQLPKGVKKVLALDNPYSRGLKAAAGMWRAKHLFRKIFTHAWVPGAPQVKYALSMGFPERAVYDGFYSADVQRFSPFYGGNAAGVFPKRFVYTGRYAREKGVELLWQAWEKAGLGEWKLECAGTGPLWDARTSAHGVLHRGFVQPSEMDTFVKSGGVFILPSLKEPWGVVLHEFAASGYPLLCSTAVGAASAFAKYERNAILIHPGSTDELHEAMRWYAAQSDDTLWAMAQVSTELGRGHTPEHWVKTAYRILEE